MSKVGNKLYIFGGRDASNVKSDKIYIYDMDNDTITQSNEILPKATLNLSSVAVGTKIYVAGGFYSEQNYISVVYDTENDSVTSTNTSISNNRCCGGMVAVGKYIYYFGGQTTTSYPTYYSSIYRYDTENDTGFNMPASIDYAQGRADMGYCLYGSKIYLFGGRVEYSNSTHSNRISVFDIQTEQMTLLPNATGTILPSGTASKAIAFSVSSNIYVFTKYTTANYKFNPQTEQIEITSDITLPNENVIDIQPIDTVNNVYLALSGSLICYKINMNLTENKMLLIYDIFAKFNIINTDTIKVKINPIDCYKGDSNNIGQQVKIALYNETQQDWVEIN